MFWQNDITDVENRIPDTSKIFTEMINSEDNPEDIASIKLFKSTQLDIKFAESVSISDLHHLTIIRSIRLIRIFRKFYKVWIIRLPGCPLTTKVYQYQCDPCFRFTRPEIKGNFMEWRNYNE